MGTPLATTAAVQYGVAAWGFNEVFELDAGYKGPAERLAVPCRHFGPDLAQLTAGDHCTLGVLNDGTPLSIGGNGFGQGGIGTRATTSVPTPVKGLTGVKEIQAAGNHVIALLLDGTVECWGGNAFGELGIGRPGTGKDGPCSLVPVKVTTLTKVVRVFAGSGCHAALKDDGSLWTFGANSNGQLGIGVTGAERDTPQRVPLEGVSSLVIGGLAQGGFMIARLENGEWMGWGANEAGELGLTGVKQTPFPTPLPHMSPDIVELAAGIRHCVARHSDGTVDAWGSDVHGQLAVKGMTDATLVDAGFGYSLVADDGKLYAAGNDKYGTCGDGDPTGADKHTIVEVVGVYQPVQLAAGAEHACAVVVGPLPEPAMNPVVGVGSIDLKWRSLPVKPRFVAAVRPAGSKEWAQKVKLPNTTREHMFAGLPSGQPVEIGLWTETASTWSRKVLLETPL